MEFVESEELHIEMHYSGTWICNDRLWSNRFEIDSFFS